MHEIAFKIFHDPQHALHHQLVHTEGLWCAQMHQRMKMRYMRLATFDGKPPHNKGIGYRSRSITHFTQSPQHTS